MNAPPQLARGDAPQAAVSLNGVWVEWLLDAFFAAGVRHVVLCPGGRASAMCIALAADPRFEVVMVCTDERSGGFVALGAAKASASPVAVVTTSGSAVANLSPALTEADACDIRLVVVSCDRPRRLRGAGFGQMANHLGATAGLVRAQADLDDPVDTPEAVERARYAVNSTLRAMHGPHISWTKAVAASPGAALGHPSPTRAAPGPVHLNVPFAGVYDALETQPVSLRTVEAARAAARPLEAGELPLPGADNDVTAIAARAVGRARARSPNNSAQTLNGLIVAGAEPGASIEAILAFAASTGFPVLADIGSGLRARPAAVSPDAAAAGEAGALIVNPFDVLGGPGRLATIRPDLIVRFGLAPVLPALHTYLETHGDVAAIKITPSAFDTTGFTADYLHPALEARDILIAPGAAHLADLSRALSRAARNDASLAPLASFAWRDRWASAASFGARQRRACVDQLTWGEVSATHACFAAPGYGFVHIGNSMSIRHADMGYDVRAIQQDVFVSRGVSGIDGTLSTFLGEAAVRPDVGLLLLGDQSLVHDLSALASAQRLEKAACICVLDNHGGAIFDYLPIARVEGYVKSIRNPYQLELGELARAFGLKHRRVDSVAALRETLGAAPAHAGVTIVELAVDAYSGATQLNTLARALGRAS
ncbi:2-succinyl-5-enolpyruvyl-6-hydroxy-3-cyclohexene-1-carboxylate synthase [Burkholderia sp. D7]|nr:2-succinyl-5-enolpyruvyl-6-hydroxy-3-cyclohexene-1-carboxylate synthase [Burkholderia sp. D7]